MKTFFVCCAFLPLMATGASAQGADAMSIARNAVPVPCENVDNIADAVFVENAEGQRAVRVTCKQRGLFSRSGAPATNAAAAGAPATNFVPLIGGLGPLLGIGAAGAAIAAAGAGGDGSSTPNTN